MQVKYSGILFSTTCLLIIIFYTIFITIHYNLENKRLYNKIIKEIKDYVIVFSLLIAMDMVISIASDDMLFMMCLNSLGMMILPILSYLAAILYVELEDVILIKF